MKARDAAAVAAYRAALSSIDNATAVPLTDRHRAGAVENAALGVGSAEVTRKHLDDNDVRDVINADIDELEAAAAELEVARPEAAAELRAQAARLHEVLPESTG